MDAGGKKLLIAGGGTGGHVFPGLAIAQEWTRRGGSVIFVGTPKGLENRLIPAAGYELHTIEVGTFKGSGVLSKIRTLLGLPRALFIAWKILRTERPDVVLGIGGFASGPACLAAWLMRLPTAITDQNAHPGLTNRILGKFVQRIFISFEPARSFFPAHKVSLTGNPVRADFAPSPYRASTDGEKFNILVFGGSQGAVAINQAFTAALDQLRDFWPRLHIEHNAGASDENHLAKFYREHGLSAEVSPFFSDMNERLARAHLVICRSGAGTLTELALCGRPAILIPYPFAADDHQKKNAAVFVDGGASWMIEQEDLQAAFLAEKIADLIRHPEKLRQAAENAHLLAMPDAAQKIVDELSAPTKKNCK